MTTKQELQVRIDKANLVIENCQLKGMILQRTHDETQAELSHLLAELASFEDASEEEPAQSLDNSGVGGSEEPMMQTGTAIKPVVAKKRRGQ